MAKAKTQESLLPPDPDNGATPLMTQYLAIKARHPDCIVFFRLGDFYEMFFEDAIKASKALDIALTRRGQFQGEDVPMCGVPFHAYENYLARLIRQGFRVAICEQMEDPAAARKRGHKAIVTRDVTRIVTPGTVTEDSLLEARDSNFLACVASTNDDLALAWLDLASGEPRTQAVSPAELSAALARVNPRELLIPQRLVENPDFFETLAPWRDQLAPQPNGRFDSENARRRLLQTYKVSELDAFGAFSRAEITALGALLDYAVLTQKSDLNHMARPQRFSLNCTIIDPATRRNLELTRTMSGERKGSLLDTIDRTLTNAGARLLAARLTAPLTDVAAINRRLDSVEFMLNQKALRETLHQALKQTPDLERASARLALGRGGPRDLAALRDALFQSGQIRSALLGIAGNEAPEDVKNALQGLGEHTVLHDKLARALAPELPLMARDGGFIARGYVPQLDDLVALRDHNRRHIALMQQKYAAESGVSALKIRHNQVIGYYIEVTPTQADKLLENKDLFIHRQTLASAVRFTTVELGELERQITEAAGKVLALELEIFAGLVQETVRRLPELRQTAESLARLDVMAGLAELAFEQDLTRPIVDDSLVFDISKGRHPVVEKALNQAENGKKFVANDCHLAPERRLWLLTGPNMAGKSTFLRQNALIALMAQMGSYVPAAKAHIGVVDRLFSRVGAADDLARGRSTFMVEMVETAAILNQAGEKALVILDEIGRGTATYDGLSIAWATVEHLHEVNRCRTLFATHYHELTQLAEKLPSLYCATMRIKEWKKEIIFMYEAVPGVADRSYGIHVAQMAGLPANVVARAGQVLHVLENGKNRKKAGLLNDNLPLFSASAPEAVPEINPELMALIDSIKPDECTPKDALALLYRITQLTGTN